MFAYVPVRNKLHTQLLNKVGISWIDNDAARFAILTGTTESFSLRAMCRVNQQIELESPSSIWYERVSSYSNPSDGPSAPRESWSLRPLHFLEPYQMTRG